MPLDRLTRRFYILLCSTCGFSNILSCRCAFGLASAVPTNSLSGCSERHEDINLSVITTPLYCQITLFDRPHLHISCHVYIFTTSVTTLNDTRLGPSNSAQPLSSPSSPNDTTDHVQPQDTRLGILSTTRQCRSCAVLTITTTHFAPVACLALALALARLPASTRCRRARHAA